MCFVVNIITDWSTSVFHSLTAVEAQWVGSGGDIMTPVLHPGVNLWSESVTEAQRLVNWLEINNLKSLWTSSVSNQNKIFPWHCSHRKWIFNQKAYWCIHYQHICDSETKVSPLWVYRKCTLLSKVYLLLLFAIEKHHFQSTGLPLWSVICFYFPLRPFYKLHIPPSHQAKHSIVFREIVQ